MIQTRFKRSARFVLICVVASLLGLKPGLVFAQATAPAGATASPAGGNGSGPTAAPVNAPGNTNPAPSSASIGNSGSATAGASVQPGAPNLSGTGLLNLTLADVVNISLGNNTAIIEAQQRLQKAQEQIFQLDAQARPQIRGDAADDYNSYKATTTTLGPTVQNPVLPSGGTIPAITDQAASEASSLTATTSTITSIAPGIATATGAGGFGEPAGSTGANPGVASGTSTTPSTTGNTPGMTTSTGEPSAPAPTGTAPSAGNAGTSSVDNGQGTTPGGAVPSGASSSSSTGQTNGQNGATTPTSGSQSGTTGSGAIDNGTSGTNGNTNSAPSGSQPGSTNNGVNDNGAGSSNNNGGGTSGNGIGGAGSDNGNSTSTPSGTTNGPANGTGADSGTAPGTGTSYLPAERSAPVVQLAALPSILQSYITATGDDGGESAQETSGGDDQVSANPHAEDSRAQSGSSSPNATTPVSNAVNSLTTADAQRNSYAARLSASQYIDLFGYVPAARDVQNSIKDFYTLDLVRTENETALNAKNTYFNALLAISQVDVQQEQVNYAAENVRITQQRRLQGIAADYDVLTAQTALANAQQALITAQNQVDLARSQLSYLLGTNPDRPLNLVGPALPPLDQSIDLNQSVIAAQQRRPELLQANRDVSIASRLVKLAGATLSPTLGLVGIAEYANTASQFTPHSLATVGAQLGVPLDDGGATRSRIRSAKVDLQTQLLNRSSLQLSVALEVRQAILNVRNAQSRVSTARVGVTQAEEALRLANVRYQNGLGTFLDVTNALAQLATARNNLANAQYFYQISLAQLVRNEGGR